MRGRRRDEMKLLKLLDAGREEERENMESRIHEAALKGSVACLLELLEEDPLILDRTIDTDARMSETPLHVAAMLGHVDLARELLTRKPQLASGLNAKGSSPLHLASAKGYLQIVRDLISISPENCLARDQGGRTPLHLAAMKGRVAVLDELIRAKPEASRVPLTSRGETVLHLCVKHNRLEALKLLLEKDDESVNWKDEDGNTILHLAVVKKSIRTIRFLLANTRVEVNSLNANGCTALDVLAKGPGDAKDTTIYQILEGTGALRAKDIPPAAAGDEIPTAKTSSTNKQVKKPKPEKKRQTDWLGRKKSALMVVASLIATVAFQGVIAPPGGVWQDDLTTDSNGNPVEKPHFAGTSVLAYNIPIAYGQYIIFNTLGFLASLSIILLLVSGLPLKRRRWMWALMVIMWLAVSSLVLTYFISLLHMTPDSVKGVLYYVTKISVLAWLGLMGVVLLANFIRVKLWLARKYGVVKETQMNKPAVPMDPNHDYDSGDDF
ncbi:PREDICTED: ankyrin repeat-containing protein ITN1-like [Nelumbo nucifera]|uniref:Ankyrin repeat-containing protein ITN1-like n=1 Tax=Nelumbo nucifera TaxID=4432 RepID=A0A1U8QB13_NELNU|nr:PREDICTED: ankyrin repeat-containing protein ITN1-like [Nelumbo nucifera]XP_019055296.1 PREDICTED: ankyrin repeat-containing protein ITN1-like [Nelumbo nucifera]